jgi:tetratricopeptide (TPR) repeat protein
MDCPRSLLLVFSLTVMCAGCLTGQKQKTTPPPTPPPIPEVPKLSAEEKKKADANTELTWGDLRLHKAFEPNLAAADKDKSLDGARRAYQRALDHDPSCAPAYAGLGKVYLALGEPDKAVAKLQEGIKRNPRNADLVVQLGNCHSCRKDWSAALQCLRKAHELEPDNRAYTRTLGLTLARAGQYKEAFQQLSSLRGNAEAYYDVARMMLHNNQPELCKQYLQYALQVNPNLEGARKLQAQLQPPASAAPAVASISFEGS